MFRLTDGDETEAWIREKKTWIDSRKQVAIAGVEACGDILESVVNQLKRLAVATCLFLLTVLGIVTLLANK